MVTLLLSYIWIWKGAFQGHSQIMLAAYFGIGLAGHRRAGEGPKAIGLRLDNALEALRLLLRWLAVPLLLVVLLTQSTWHFPPIHEWPGDLIWGFVWGTAQQYGLLCVMYRRLREVFPDGKIADLIAAGLFALFHIPNLFLMGVTLITGYVSCRAYRRFPNLWVVGLFHCIVSFAISHSFPDSLSLSMKVGPR
ncbi:CPBP family intramembrane glutamic endopeptidase [Sulfidibacter corallicola]|uniref:CPBP family intramembrane metalloprotease n=1 Tax=Sulfidibacter corallicola TaxID=2818388 RepID=A0A8A4TIP3_SULCO|nr:CPBP family intramembrane glutamic endopeptidase [Sulfidibacter corallicola]QTD49022.1 CPBP family intramembrane metalloprotease [Sulfidibacter corallicola]